MEGTPKKLMNTGSAALLPAATLDDDARGGELQDESLVPVTLTPDFASSVAQFMRGRGG